MLFSICVSFVVAALNLIFLYLYSLLREKCTLGSFFISFLTIALIPFFFFVTLYPMVLTHYLTKNHNYVEVWGFVTEFFVYALFCYIFRKEIKKHLNNWKIKFW